MGGERSAGGKRSTWGKLGLLGTTAAAASTATATAAISSLIRWGKSLCRHRWGLHVRGRSGPTAAPTARAAPLSRVTCIERQCCQLLQDLVLIGMKEMLLLGKELDGLIVALGRVGRRSGGELAL